MDAVEYKVCETTGRDGLQKLEKMVNDLIADGWEPTGGVQVVEGANKGTWWYYQAMVYKQSNDQN
jgi:hypothetical protein